MRIRLFDSDYDRDEHAGASRLQLRLVPEECHPWRLHGQVETRCDERSDQEGLDDFSGPEPDIVAVAWPAVVPSQDFEGRWGRPSLPHFAEDTLA